MPATYDLVIDKIAKDGYHYHLKLWLKDYIVQECKHSDSYRERFGEHCCNSHKYQDQDIRELLKEYD